MTTRSVRYGTPLYSFLAKNVFAKFPNAQLRQQIVQTAEECNFDGFTPFDTTARANSIPSVKGFPTVSLLNSCSPESQQSLYWWQYNLMKEIGETEFSKFMQKNLVRGTKFHAIVCQLLKTFHSDGKMPELNKTFMEKCGELAGFIQSVMCFLSELKVNPLMCMERRVYHPSLCYHGKFDALIELNGSLTLVDWKTVNVYSTKAQRKNTEAIGLAELYSNPSQVAAYIAAFNACHIFLDYPKITQGAVVLAYEDGRPAETILMNEMEVQEHFEIHLRNVNHFWHSMESQKPDRFGQISFLYNPVLSSIPPSAGGGVVET